MWQRNDTIFIWLSIANPLFMKRWIFHTCPTDCDPTIFFVKWFFGDDLCFRRDSCIHRMHRRRHCLSDQKNGNGKVSISNSYVTIRNSKPLPRKNERLKKQNLGDHIKEHPAKIVISKNPFSMDDPYLKKVYSPSMGDMSHPHMICPKWWSSTGGASSANSVPISSGSSG